MRHLIGPGGAWRGQLLHSTLLQPSCIPLWDLTGDSVLHTCRPPGNDSDIHVQGGVLYVRPRKAQALVKKNFFKGGWLHSTATVHASIAGHSKKTAQVDGSNPTFSDVIEFILGQPQLCTL